MLLVNTTRNISHSDMNTTTLPIPFNYDINTIVSKQTSIKISGDIFRKQNNYNDLKVKSDKIFRNNILRNAVLTGMSCAYLLSSTKSTNPQDKNSGNVESNNITLGEVNIPVEFGKQYENIFKISNSVLNETPIENVAGLINGYKFHILKGLLLGRCVSMKKARIKIDFNNGTAIKVNLIPRIRKDS